MQADTIIYCNDNPIRIDGSERLNTYLGRIAVGRRIGASLFEILAYSDNIADSSTLRTYAKSNHALYIRSIDNAGVTAID